MEKFFQFQLIRLSFLILAQLAIILWKLFATEIKIEGKESIGRGLNFLRNKNLNICEVVIRRIRLTGFFPIITFAKNFLKNS